MRECQRKKKLTDDKRQPTFVINVSSGLDPSCSSVELIVFGLSNTRWDTCFHTCSHRFDTTLVPTASLVQSLDNIISNTSFGSLLIQSTLFTCSYYTIRQNKLVMRVTYIWQSTRNHFNVCCFNLIVLPYILLFSNQNQRNKKELPQIRLLIQLNITSSDDVDDDDLSIFVWLLWILTLPVVTWFKYKTPSRFSEG